MNALVILDNKKGHANISKGLLKAIKTKVEVRATYFLVKPFWSPISKLLSRIWPKGSNIIDLIFRTAPNITPRPDLIIASGGNTLWWAAALSRKFEAISVFCGSSRKLPIGTIDILLHYDPLVAEKEKGIHIPLTPSFFSTEKKNVNICARKNPKRNLYTCLIGGDGGGYKWRHDDYRELANILNDLGKEYNAGWLISSSRRTPKYVAKLFDSIINPEFIVDNCWYQLGDNREVLPQYIADSDFVLVTEDSASMLHESIGNCRPTCSISPRTSNPDQCLLNFLTVAESRCWLFRANVETFSTKGFFARIKCLRPLETSNNHFVGDIIVDKIQQLTSMR